MTAPIPKLETLQILRGIAALLIVAHHALYEVNIISPKNFNYGSNQYYTVGIDIFFVLSGFIMVYTSWGKAGLRSAKSFIMRRVIRIVPIYWFHTLLIGLVALVMPQVLGSAEFVLVDFIKSLFFIPYVNTAGDLQPILANGWSLNYEMYFYIIFAVCLLFPSRLSLLVLGAYFLGTVSTGFLSLDNLYADFYSRPIILEFFVGAVIGYLFMKGFRLPSWFIYIGALFIVLSVLTLFYTNMLSEYLPMEYYKPFVGFFSVLLLVLPKGAEKLKMPRPAVFMGDASYTIYLSHPFGIGAVTQMVLFLGWESLISPWLIFIAVFAACIIGGAIAYLLIEKPLTVYLKRVLFPRNNDKT